MLGLTGRGRAGVEPGFGYAHWLAPFAETLRKGFPWDTAKTSGERPAGAASTRVFRASFRAGGDRARRSLQRRPGPGAESIWARLLTKRATSAAFSDRQNEPSVLGADGFANLATLSVVLRQKRSFIAIEESLPR